MSDDGREIWEYIEEERSKEQGDCRHCYCWKPGNWCCWCEEIVGEPTMTPERMRELANEITASAASMGERIAARGTAPEWNAYDNLKDAGEKLSSAAMWLEMQEAIDNKDDTVDIGPVHVREAVDPNDPYADGVWECADNCPHPEHNSEDDQ